MSDSAAKGLAQKGDVIVLDGQRLVVRERDRSVLSPNLGLLVCPVETAEDDQEGSFWTRRDDYEVEREHS